jgi:hypothetical protein
VARNETSFASGGIAVDNSNGKLINSKLTGNKVIGLGCCGGGATVLGTGKLTVRASIVRGNESPGDGGGINVISSGLGLVMKNSSVFSNSSGDEGGGIRFTGTSSGEITNSTISLNHALGGGGIIESSSEPISLTHVTITKNSGGAGGGVWSNGNTPVLRSIIAANSDGDCNAPLVGPTGKNLDKDSTCFNSGSPIHAPPRLRVLGNFGGPTPTHLPLERSAAVDQAGGAACPDPERDQRGVRRPKNGDGDPGSSCDLGSVERKPGELT